MFILLFLNYVAKLVKSLQYTKFFNTIFHIFYTKKGTRPFHNVASPQNSTIKKTILAFHLPFSVRILPPISALSLQTRFP